MEKAAERTRCLLFFLAVFFCVIAAGEEVSAERYRFQWEARLDVSEQYDDNIFLTPVARNDDWITRVTPGLTLSLLKDEIQGDLTYDFSLVHYAQNNERSIVRHYITLSGLEDVPLAKHVTLDLDAYLLISEDPLEITPVDEDLIALTRTRDRYYRSTAGGKINYLFGPENSVYIGFTGLFLQNEDVDAGNRRQYVPTTGMDYWFSVRYGVHLDYSYGSTDFDLTENYQEHRCTGSFSYRNNPRTETTLSYVFDNLDYDGPRMGYDLHEVTLGLTHEFNEQTYGSLSGGYSVVVEENGENLGKPAAALSFNHITRRAVFALAGNVGYRRQFFSLADIGLSFYASASVTINYRIMERLSASCTGGYFRDEYLETTPSRESDNWRGAASFNYTFMSWLLGSVTYEFRERQSSDDAWRLYGQPCHRQTNSYLFGQTQAALRERGSIWMQDEGPGLAHIS